MFPNMDITHELNIPQSEAAGPWSAHHSGLLKTSKTASKTRNTASILQRAVHSVEPGNVPFWKHIFVLETALDYEP